MSAKQEAGTGEDRDLTPEEMEKVAGGVTPTPIVKDPNAVTSGIKPKPGPPIPHMPPGRVPPATS